MFKDEAKWQKRLARLDTTLKKQLAGDVLTLKLQLHGLEISHNQTIETVRSITNTYLTLCNSTPQGGSHGGILHSQ